MGSQRHDFQPQIEFEDTELFSEVLSVNDVDMLDKDDGLLGTEFTPKLDPGRRVENILQHF